MKLVSIILVLLATAASGVALLPEAAAYQPALSYVAPALGVLAFIAVLLLTRMLREPSAGREAAQSLVVRPLAEAARPVSALPVAYEAKAGIVGFLAILQAKGRLVDFLMDDINSFNDTQVGAAARVVHAGCKAVLLEHFKISAVRLESEGARVEVPAGYVADEYRLLGKVSGVAPFSGVLVHHGWKTDQVTLPRMLPGSEDRLPTIAPAEVELK